MNTEQKCICVSRPRRFGKSMALKMLAAYYSCGCDSRDLFKGCKIESNETFEKHLNKYNVIYLNMQQFLIRAKKQGVTEYLERVVISDIRKVYGELFAEEETILSVVLEQIYSETKRKFIFLVDEWDCVVRERQESEDMQKQYLDFLRDLLKDQPYVALAYMTGILPVKKYGEHSALNMFWEYSMTDQKVLEEYTGFTEEEVKALCERFDMDFAETRSWYDGYMFTNFKHIYNPRSVVEAMSCHKFSNYWTSTEVYDALKTYIDMDFDGLRKNFVQMLGGEQIRVSTLSFKNDMRNFKVKDDVLTLLIHLVQHCANNGEYSTCYLRQYRVVVSQQCHRIASFLRLVLTQISGTVFHRYLGNAVLGYLAYDSTAEEAFIPNKEMIREFENAMSVGGWSEAMRVLKASEKLLKDTLDGDAQSIAEALDRAHTEVSSILTYNDENSLGCAIGLAYYSVRKVYRFIREFPAGKGFADIVFLPLPHTDKPAIVVELKYDKTAETALQQIKDRHYTQALEGYSGEILLVGINYNKDQKAEQHSCLIEKMVK